MNIIETKNLTKNYRGFGALKNVNMHVQKGDIYGFVGKNGAGKTTLIRIICGLQNPSSGDYFLYNANYKSYNMRYIRKRMGAIIETPALYLDETAAGNLRQQLELLGNTDLEAIPRILKLVGLENTGTKKVKNFSLGMRERLAIGLTLASNPDLIILDEPTNGLDPEGIVEIRELILKLNRNYNITFLISSHILDELAKLATRYGFIKNGELVKEITAEELKKECKKSLLLKPTNLRMSLVVLDRMGLEYKVVSNCEIEIYNEIDITELVLNLAKENVKILKITENDENLETYFMKLLGGNNHA